MILNYLDYICCVECKSDLKKIGGFLVCKNCNKKFEIINGIPMMVNINNLPVHFLGQIEYFEKETATLNLSYKIDFWQKSYVDRFEENFTELDNKIIIDCGTGSGYMAIELARKGCRVVACDLNLMGLVRLKKIVEDLGLLDKILFICCSAEELPFKNNIADFYVSNAVLEHLLKEKEAINEINRVCNNKSGCMITVPIKLRYTWPFFWLVYFIADKKIGHLRRYDEKDLFNKFNKFGYKIKKTYYTGHLIKVCKVLFNDFIWKIFNLFTIENQDKNLENKKYGASVICAILYR